MKRILPLILAAAATSSAERLGTSSHIGVEEIGERLEFFAPPEADRDTLLQRNLEAENDVEETIDPISPKSDRQLHSRDLAVSCSSNESKVLIKLTTDGAGSETSYVIKDSSNKAVLAMPDGGSFGNRQTYSKQVCLSPGQYTLRMKDSGGDGFCGNGSGCGSISVSVDGSSVLDISQDKSDWSVVDKKFSVIMFSGRNSMGGSSQTFSGDSGFKDKSCWNVQVYTLLDKYGKETSWEIKKKGTSSVKASMGPVLEAWGEDTSDKVCLPAGDYTLTFKDIDGICCKNGPGKYELLIDGEVLLAGGSFIGSDSHDFKLGHDWGESMVSRDWEYLLAHNERREDWHTRCTSNYCNKKARPLRWSAGLASDAKVYAEKLLDTCEDTGIKHDPGLDQGENLAKNKGRGTWGSLYAADKIVKRFIDNEATWSWHDNAHFTQGLWYATKYLGCAESHKIMDNGDSCRMQVCRYAKAGNCEMSKYNSEVGRNFEKPMMADDTPCGPVCPPEGCYP